MKRALVAVGLAAQVAVSVTSASALEVADFFRPDLVSRVRINPEGSLIALVRTGEDDDVRVRVYDVHTRAVREVLSIIDRPDARIDLLAWADSDSLVISVDKRKFGDIQGPDPADPEIYVVNLERTGAELVHHNFTIRRPGVVVDPLPGEDDTVLYAPSRPQSTVFRIPLSKLLRYSPDGGERAKGVFTRRTLVAQLPDFAFLWYADPRGEVRAAMTASEEGVLRLHYRASSEEDWRVVYSLDLAQEDAEVDLLPLGFAEGDKLLVASRRDRDTWGLFEFDVDSGEIGRLLYAHPTAEIVDLLMDYSGTRVLAVVYNDSGVPGYHYFEGGARETTRALERHFPGYEISTTGLSADGRKGTVLVWSGRDPGVHYYFDVDAGRTTRIGPVAPWLPAEELAPVRRYRVESTGGIEVDAFLALPSTRSGRPPLVVQPHGGPIGVEDTGDFDPEMQLLASRGLAVLKVNYRGSSGYGKAFQEAGRQQWGRGIEDDIDAAVAHAVEQGWVDASRMCMSGGSYGGYSALMMVIRHPKRFRCAATLAGVSDIPLFVEGLHDSWRDAAADLIGDPDAQYEELRRFSPVYQLDDLEVPVFVAHGSDDARVDIEHSRRLGLMLELLGKEYEMHVLDGVGHGFESSAEAVNFYQKLLDFLTRHLIEPAS